MYRKELNDIFQPGNKLQKWNNSNEYFERGQLGFLKVIEILDGK